MSPLLGSAERSRGHPCAGNRPNALLRSPACRPRTAPGGRAPVSRSVRDASRSRAATPRSSRASMARPSTCTISRRLASRPSGCAMRWTLPGLRAPHPPGAQGATRPRLPAVPARRSAVRRDRRVLTRRGRLGARARVDRRGDQLHGHERVGARPRSAAAHRGPPQRGPPLAARAARSPSAGLDRRYPGEPRDRRLLPGRRGDAVRGQRADEVRHPAGATGRRRCDRTTPRPHDRHRALPLGLPVHDRVDPDRRGGGAPRGRHGPRAPGAGLPDRRGQHRRGLGRAVPSDRHRARCDRVGRSAGAPARRSRRGGGHRARRVPGQAPWRPCSRRS